MSVLIRKPGILTTIQDLGRHGHARLGINPSGAMDRTAVRLINILLGNHEGDTVLEMHFPAPEIEFDADVCFALGGGDFAASLGSKPVANWRINCARKGDVLHFDRPVQGHRCYLAVDGGFDVSPWLGSRSTNLAAGIGGFEGRRLIGNDRVPVKSSNGSEARGRSKLISPSVIPRYSRFPTVRIILGHEYALLNPQSKNRFTEQTYQIGTNSDRMGYRLSGQILELETKMEMVSAAASFGLIQLLPDGQLAILLADHQTAGGYPRIGSVIAPDLPLLAQLGAGDKVAFHPVSLEQAEAAYFELERDIAFFRTGCRFMN